MKRISIYAVAAMLAISGAANVAAADDVVPKLTYNETNETNVTHGEVIVTGNLDGVAEGSLISLTVYDKDAGIATGLKWYDQIKAGENGKYDFICTLEGETGKEYMFAVAAEGHPGEANMFKYYSKETAKKLVNDTTTDGVKKVIDEFNSFLQVDTSIYDELTNESKGIVIANAAEELKKLKIENNNKLTSADFAEVLEDCSRIQRMNDFTDNAKYKAELLDIAKAEVPAVAKIFEAFEDTDIDAIVTEMSAVDYALKSDMIADFNDKVLSKAANDAEVPAEMQNIVTSAAKEIGIYLNTFGTLSASEKATAMSIMLSNNSYTSCEDIKNAFDSAVVEATSTSVSSSGSGGGRGTLEAMPQPVVIEGPFADLASVKWAVDSIRALYVKGVVSGDENGNFNPNNNVTRAEFVKMLVSAMNMESKETDLAFDDVKADAWYYDYVITAAENELVSGMTESTFGPNLPITRQDAAVIIHRAAGIKNVNLDAIKVADILDEAQIADYAKEPVKTLYATGLLNGVGEGNFAPKNNMTRAQAAVIMNSFLERMEATK